MHLPCDKPDCRTCTARSHSVFSELLHLEQVAFTDRKSCAMYKTGEEIFREGTYPAGLYCVFSGKIKVSKYGPEGREQIVRFATPGDVLGYRALLCAEPYSAGAIALADSQLCFIPRDLFGNTLQKNPALSLKFIQLLSHDLQVAETRMVELAQKTVRERLAETLLVLRNTFGTTGDGSLDVTLSREEIANIVGTATESVIRLLSDFKKVGLIDLRGKRIAILNERRLADEASMEEA